MERKRLGINFFFCNVPFSQKKLLLLSLSLYNRWAIYVYFICGACTQNIVNTQRSALYSRAQSRRSFYMRVRVLVCL